VRVFYGSTEAGNVASLEHADIRGKPGSCGVPSPSSEVRIDEDGELCVRGPLLFDGYFGDPEATAGAVVDGWYRTGDLAEKDESGYLTIVGRAGDLIRSGGESVAPGEVEAALADHPAVMDVAVVGLPDVQWGEEVSAVIVPRPGAPVPTLAELRAHCDGRIASFKQPRRLVVAEVIPRTVTTQQIQRRLLKEAVLRNDLAIAERR
jgi:acyl-CoA synthetase (AMP-forming)/AMP-acid ligase II